MTSDPRYRSSGDRGSQSWPRWMIVVVPLLVVVVVAGLWWALIAPEPSEKKTATPTVSVAGQAAPQVSPTMAATGQGSQLETPEPTPTGLPALAPSPTPEGAEIATPTPEAVAAAAFVEGDIVLVFDTGGAGLRMRIGAGTGYDRVKTLDEATVLEVVGGPKDADGLAWYQVRDATGATGWVAGDYLKMQEP